MALATALAGSPACRSSTAQGTSDGPATEGSASEVAPDEREEAVEMGEVGEVEEVDMIDTIRSLCQLLVSEPVTITELAEHLGTVTHRFGEGRRLVVEPTDPSLEAVRLAGAPDTLAPRIVHLTPRRPYQTTVADLVAAFGDYTALPRTHPEDLLSVRFVVDVGPDVSAVCLLHATVGGSQYSPEADIEDGPVSLVSLRRSDRAGGGE